MEIVSSGGVCTRLFHLTGGDFFGKILFRPQTAGTVQNAMSQFGIALLRMRTVEDSAMDDPRLFPCGLFGTENMMGKPGGGL